MPVHLKKRQVRKSQTLKPDTLWWLTLVHSKTGEVLGRPVFLVSADTWEEAVAKVERRLDRDEFPPAYKLQPQIVEFGEMGKDVAWL